MFLVGYGFDANDAMPAALGVSEPRGGKLRVGYDRFSVIGSNDVFVNTVVRDMECGEKMVA